MAIYLQNTKIDNNNKSRLRIDNEKNEGIINKTDLKSDIGTKNALKEDAVTTSGTLF